MADVRAGLTPVRHQGDRGTCVAFAVAAAHEWSVADMVVRSAEDVMWAAHQVGTAPGSEAISVDWATKGLALHGHSRGTQWPYGNPIWDIGRPAAARVAGDRLVPGVWRSLATTMDALDAELIADRVVVLTVGFVPGAWRDPAGKVGARPGQKTVGNHAVLCVGTTSDPDGYVVKNSWGSGWGDAGYGYLSPDYLLNYLVRAHTLERSKP